ncbi:MAG: ADP-ribosylglycohydrolase family protein, partial [Dethiosulfatibacter sp.]|nr:ADP-ribosylglycohydrolase family protein [Dethiosulfatibacter sp.]
KDMAFKMAADFAALTHGHPSGYLSAGALAYLISSILQ